MLDKVCPKCRAFIYELTKFENGGWIRYEICENPGCDHQERV